MDNISPEEFDHEYESPYILSENERIREMQRRAEKRRILKERQRRQKKKQRLFIRRILTIPFIFLVLFLETLPSGVIIKQKVATDFGYIEEQFRCAFISTSAMSNGSIGPTITCVLTILVCVLSILYLITKNRGYLSLSKLVNITAIFTSLWPIALGFSNFTWVNFFITLFLIMQQIMIFTRQNVLVRDKYGNVYWESVTVLIERNKRKKRKMRKEA